MEGSNLQEDDSITDSQIISKVTSVVTGSSSTPSVTITTTVPRIKTNGQAVLLQSAGVPGQQQQQQQQIHHHQSSPTPMTIVSGSNIVVGGGGGGGVSSAGSTIVSTINNSNNSNNNNTNANNNPNQTVNHHQHHSGGGAAHKSVPTVTTVPASSQSSHQQQQHQHQQQQSMVSAGSMSIVQFQLPTNQSPSTTMVQSVIQPNHQSVIQQTNPISAIQLPKNVILVNKLPGSVIQSTESESNIQMVKEENDAVNQIYEDEPKRRREILARRPSYRKILNDLSAGDTGGGGGGSTNVEVNKSESEESDQTSPANSQSSSATAISLPTSYIKMLPLGQLNSQDGTIQGIPTIMNPNTGSNTIVQYATSGHDGQFIVPADLQAYQLRPQNPSAIAQNVVMTSQNIPTHTVDEAMKKREMRLLKNREAAKECRRKKKEYIKCLENRVAVLENQNKALIDELKTLKELYCKKSD